MTNSGAGRKRMKDEPIETGNKKRSAKRNSPPPPKKDSAAARSAASQRSARSVAPAKKKAPARAKTVGAGAAAVTKSAPTLGRPRRGQAITEEQRRSMIAERAYFKAERRGFIGGDPLGDWCDAEAEIDALILRGTDD